MDSRLLDAGTGPPVGAYLLRIEVCRAAAVRFGRFARGRTIAIPAGMYIYVGSAYAKQARPLLLTRVLRHLTRVDGAPHELYARLHSHINDLGRMEQAVHGRRAASTEPPCKTLRWHIDYLLEQRCAEVRQVILLRSRTPNERNVAGLLAARPDTAPIEPGLGASDDPGATHLLQWQGGLNAWRSFLVYLIQHSPDLSNIMAQSPPQLR